MRHYRRYERPTEGTHEPTRVWVSIKILAITSVDVINMQYTADMMLVQTWKDPRLRWQHLSEYQAISGDILLTHKRNEIWLPDLFFRNGKEGFLYRMTVPNHMIRVSPDGSIYYSQKITMKLACEMHLRNFPMDHQDCDMDIGSYGYTIDQLKFIWDGDNALKFADGMLISEFNTPSSTVTEVKLQLFSLKFTPSYIAACFYSVYFLCMKVNNLAVNIPADVLHLTLLDLFEKKIWTLKCLFRHKVIILPALKNSSQTFN